MDTTDHLLIIKILQTALISTRSLALRGETEQIVQLADAVEFIANTPNLRTYWEPEFENRLSGFLNANTNLLESEVMSQFVPLSEYRLPE